MKTNLLKTLFFLIITAGVFTGCVNDDDYSIPNVGNCVDADITVTKTIAEINAMATTTAQKYTADDVIEGYVVSSDRGGNFYKTLYLNSEDGAIGFSVQVNATDLFNDYNVGRKVYIKLKDLYIQKRSSTLQIGALYNGNVGQIATLEYKSKLIRSCDTKPESELVNFISLDQINDSYVGKLVEFDAVQFATSSVGQNYYNPANLVGSETNHTLTDADGNTVIFRTGQYAEYSGLAVPNNSGKVRGVLTKFNADYQFVARYASDIKLDQPRIVDEPGEPGEPGEPSETARGGSEIVYATSLSEDFESYTATSIINYTAPASTTFPKYVNDAAQGPRWWAITQFSGNKYLQMSAHNTNSAAKTYFVVPANFTGGAELQFKTKDGYNNGQVLKVYWSTSYTPGTTITASMLNDITSQFTIANAAPSGGYATNFTNSGAYTIPATGNGFIIFEYTGSHPGGATTTMQLDDIVIN